jgi:hypothetical protein
MFTPHNQHYKRLLSSAIPLFLIAALLLQAGPAFGQAVASVAQVVHRVNAGGPALEGGWTADNATTRSPLVSGAGHEFASTTNAINLHSSVPAGTPTALFRTERYDTTGPQGGTGPMVYRFPVTNGTYDVRLYFSEIFTGAQAVGKRQFDVALQGTKVLNAYDTFADVGGYTGVVKTYPATATNGILTVAFDHVPGKDQPRVMGIEVVTRPSSTPTPTPTPAPAPEPAPAPAPEPAPAPAPGGVNWGGVERAAGLTGPVGPDAAYVPSGDVVVQTGQLTQAFIDARPTGTKFVLAAGKHRFLSHLTPKADMAFLGRPGAIISGSKVLTGWTREGNAWFVSGQTQRMPKTHAPGWNICKPTAPFCDHGEDTFLDGVELRQVGALSALQSGTFFFDYGRSRIYLADDPNGRLVETTNAPQAFVDGGRGVTYRNLIFEHFGNAGQQAVVRGVNLSVERTTFRYNHGSGITQYGGVFRGNKVHHNGQIGVTGGGSNLLIENNEIAYNNNHGFDPNWEAGATKWAYATGLTVRNNWSHNNAGSGLWTDINNRGVRFERNLIEDNDYLGISHEISYDVTISENVIRRNGYRAEFKWDPVRVGIMINNSSGARIFHNIIENNAGGAVLLRQDNRVGPGSHGPWTISNNSVYNNRFIGGRGMTGIDVDRSMSNWATYQNANNRFYDNSYVNFDPATKLWWLNLAPRTMAEWNAAGHN